MIFLVENYIKDINKTKKRKTKYKETLVFRYISTEIASSLQTRIAKFSVINQPRMLEKTSAFSWFLVGKKLLKTSR